MMGQNNSRYEDFKKAVNWLGVVVGIPLSVVYLLSTSPHDEAPLTQTPVITSPQDEVPKVQTPVVTSPYVGNPPPGSEFNDRAGTDGNGIRNSREGSGSDGISGGCGGSPSTLNNGPVPIC